MRSSWKQFLDFFGRKKHFQKLSYIIETVLKIISFAIHEPPQKLNPPGVPSAAIHFGSCGALLSVIWLPPTMAPSILGGGMNTGV